MPPKNSSCTKIQIRQTVGSFRLRVELGWPIFLHLKKRKIDKCLLRENETNQIFRLFVTNLLLYVSREGKKNRQTKKHKNFHIFVI